MCFTIISFTADYICIELSPILLHSTLQSVIRVCRCEVKDMNVVQRMDNVISANIAVVPRPFVRQISSSETVPVAPSTGFVKYQ